MIYEVLTGTARARPTAVMAATTTWPEYPRVWRSLLDQVWANVRWGGTGPKGRNVMLYLDDVPHVEVGVEVTGTFEPSGRVVPSALHLLGGGCLNSQDRDPEVRLPTLRPDLQLRAVIVAGASDHDWLVPQLKPSIPTQSTYALPG